MSTLIMVLHVIVCLFLMLTVLMQSGKGGGMGGAFGGGNAATVFGGSGASTFLRKLTAGAATIFMITSMVLAFIASHNAADALERFGESQQKLAAEKEAARTKALEGAGSAGSAAPTIMMPPDMGSAAAGSASDPGSPQGGTSGSVVTPTETPSPAGATDPTPSPATPAGVSPPAPATKPAAEKPAAEKPAAEKPAAPAPKPAAKPAVERPAAAKPAAPAVKSAPEKPVAPAAPAAETPAPTTPPAE